MYDPFWKTFYSFYTGPPSLGIVRVTLSLILQDWHVASSVGLLLWHRPKYPHRPCFKDLFGASGPVRSGPVFRRWILVRGSSSLRCTFKVLFCLLLSLFLLFRYHEVSCHLLCSWSYGIMLHPISKIKKPADLAAKPLESWTETTLSSFN